MTQRPCRTWQVPENLADRVDPPAMDPQAADAEEPQEPAAEKRVVRGQKMVEKLEILKHLE